MIGCLFVCVCVCVGGGAFNILALAFQMCHPSVRSSADRTDMQSPNCAGSGLAHCLKA